MNIKEVAKLAKVSTATVSRTINGSDKVSARTAARVQKAIKELNFYPNTHARTLVSGRSRMLAPVAAGKRQHETRWVGRHQDSGGDSEGRRHLRQKGAGM